MRPKPAERQLLLTFDSTATESQAERCRRLLAAVPLVQRGSTLRSPWKQGARQRAGDTAKGALPAGDAPDHGGRG